MFFSNTNRIKRILQVRGTCFPKDNICMQDNSISHGEQISLSTRILSTRLFKKNFFLFLPSHPHKCGSNALFIGVSVVRVGAFYPHTALTPSFPCRNALLIGGKGKLKRLFFTPFFLCLFTENP